MNTFEVLTQVEQWLNLTYEEKAKRPADIFSPRMAAIHAEIERLQQAATPLMAVSAPTPKPRKKAPIFVPVDVEEEVLQDIPPVQWPVEGEESAKNNEVQSEKDA